MPVSSTVPSVTQLTQLVTQVAQAHEMPTLKTGSPDKSQETSQSCINQADRNQAISLTQLTQLPPFFTIASLKPLTGLTKNGVKYQIAKRGIETQKILGSEGYRKGSEICQYPTESLFAKWPEVIIAWEAQNLQIIHKQEEEKAALEAHKNDLVAIAKMPEWRRRVSDARQGILIYIQQEAERLEDEAQAQGDHSSQQEKAITLFIADALRKTLPTEIQTLLPIANARYRKGGAICRRTIFGWKAEAEVNGGAGLAPKEVEFKEPDFAQHLLKAYRKPSKPSLRYVVMYDLPKALEGTGIELPTYAQCRHYLKNHIGEIDKLRGRMGPRELRTRRSYRKRLTSKLLPLDVVVADGHTFKAEVAHPDNGKPFRPEVTQIIDVKTRKIVGISVDVSENALAVLAAIRCCALMHGVPAVFYCDNGSGYNNQWVEAVMARLGTTKTNSEPHNARGHGLVENLHRNVLVPCARQFPTYIGKDMDREAKQASFKKTRAKVPGTLPSWDDFRKAIFKAIDDYNARPHRALPYRRDENGKRVHLSPNEAWLAAVDAGFKYDKLPPESAWELLPSKVKTVRQCLIKLHNHEYYSKALEQFDGLEVCVGFDPLDASRVWVSALDGRFLAEAVVDGHASDYFPTPYIEQAQAKREDAQLRRGLEKVGRRQGMTLAGAGLSTLEMGDRVRAAAEEPPETEALGLSDKQEALANQIMAAVGKEKAEDAIDRYDRIKAAQAAGEAVTEEDLKWAAHYETTTPGKALLLLASQPISLKASNG